jgi:hypothetical protein
MKHRNGTLFKEFKERPPFFSKFGGEKLFRGVTSLMVYLHEIFWLIGRASD